MVFFDELRVLLLSPKKARSLPNSELCHQNVSQVMESGSISLRLSGDSNHVTISQRYNCLIIYAELPRKPRNGSRDFLNHETS